MSSHPNPPGVDDWISPIVRRELRNLAALKNLPDHANTSDIPPPSNDDTHYAVMATQDDLLATLTITLDQGTNKYLQVSSLDPGALAYWPRSSATCLAMNTLSRTAVSPSAPS
jgi:hypothetical protein